MNNDNQIKIELTGEVAMGIYTNLTIISHSTSEFILDFIRLVPGVEEAKVQSRIIVTPENAKRLLYALDENIHKYEAQFGEVKLHRNDDIIPPLSGVTGEA